MNKHPITDETDEQINERLSDIRGLDRLLKAIEELEEQEPERWDGME